jgi:hypothetical protein
MWKFIVLLIVVFLILNRIAAFLASKPTRKITSLFGHKDSSYGHDLYVFVLLLGVSFVATIVLSMYFKI